MEVESRSRCKAYAGAERGGAEGDKGVRYEGVLDKLGRIAEIARNRRHRRDRKTKSSLRSRGDVEGEIG